MDRRINEAIVLAGGFGTRLQSVVKDVPKPMADINGKPFLHYLLAQLAQNGIQTVVLSVGYKHEKIQNHFKDTYLQMKIKYAIEKEPLGTGGAIKLALSQIEGNQCFVLNGDTFFDISLTQLKLDANADCVLAAYLSSDDTRYGTLKVDEQNKINEFKEKGQGDSGWINGGIYVIRKSIFDSVHTSSFSFETETLTSLAQNERLKFQGFDAYFKDIGIPEDYAAFQKHMLVPLDQLQIDKSWTLFLDRDGVINERLIDDYVKQLNELSIINGVPEAIAYFCKIFKRVVVVTNQQGIGKGNMNETDLEIIHGYMNEIFEAEGGTISKFYFAPQLATSGSNYRKPGTGMGIHAKEDFPDIDFKKCLLIGDSESDIDFGTKLGMKTIMLTKVRNILTKADYIFEDLQSVSKKLKK